MKINYIHQYFTKPTKNGGVRSYEIARRLVKDGHSVNMLCLSVDSRSENLSHESYEGIDIFYCPVTYSQEFSFIRRIAVFLFFAIWATWKNIFLRSDVTYASSTPLTVGVPAVLGRLIAKKKYVFEVRDVWPEVPIAMGYLNNRVGRYLAKLLEKISYRYASQIISLSPDMAASIYRRLSYQSHVIPNFSSLNTLDIVNNEELASKLNAIRSRHEFIIGYTGTIGKVNNVSYLVDLVSRSSYDLALLIIGKGNDESDVKKLSDKLGLTDRRVYFVKPIPKSALRIVHQNIDIAASTVSNIPALFANSANKIFDAFAMGTPILINHKGWLAELIDKENCGIALNSEASSSELEKLYGFLSSVDSYSEARESAKRLSFRFSPEYLYPKVVDVIERVKESK